MILLPNAELLVTTFLRTDADVVAVLGDEIYTELPKGHDTWPACRVTRIGGAADNLGVVDEPLVQISVWGGPKLTAERAAATVRAALATRLPVTLPALGALALGPGDRALGSLRDVPDTTYDPTRPRFILDARLLTRPL